MGQVTLNREDAERTLANPDADPGVRLVSALAIAMFEATDSAPEAEGEYLNISRKLLHLIQCQVWDAIDDLPTQAQS